MLTLDINIFPADFIYYEDRNNVSIAIIIVIVHGQLIEYQISRIKYCQSFISAIKFGTCCRGHMLTIGIFIREIRDYHQELLSSD